MTPTGKVHVMDNHKIADWLGKARRYLEEHGWRQHDLGRRGHQACALGALVYGMNAPEFVDDEYGEDVTYLAGYLVNIVGDLDPHKLYQVETDRLAVWNDMEGRTAQEVIDLFAKGEKVALAGFDPDAP